MLRFAAIMFLFAACSNSSSEASKKSPPPVTSTIGADGLRHIPIEAGEKGYVPDRIIGKPGEKLVLVFKRTVDGECLAKVKAPDGKLVDLPKGTPVDVAVTLPQTGAVTFACGMDMFKGTVVVDDKT
ncbi:MAG: cupredoxin domain-containing protein [Kofleriaceae bacterium]